MQAMIPSKNKDGIYKLVGEKYNTKTLQPALKIHNIIIQRLKMGKLKNFFWNPLAKSLTP